MGIDLSVFKNIDFTSKDNMIFLSLCLLAGLVAGAIFFLVLKKIVRLIVRAIVVTFNLDVRKPRFDKKNSTEWLHVKQEPQENSNITFKGLQEQNVPAGTVNCGVVKKVDAGADLGLDKLKGGSNGKVHDTSIFGEGAEVAKTKLEHEMRTNSKIWEAAEQEGLSLNAVERAKLVKEVFSPAVGRNISKTDLKQSVKKLNQKLLNTQNSDEHAKLRKEIKFFKKIGGIKG